MNFDSPSIHHIDHFFLFYLLTLVDAHTIVIHASSILNRRIACHVFLPWMVSTWMVATFERRMVRPNTARLSSRMFVVTIQNAPTFIQWVKRKIPSPSKRYKLDMLRQDGMSWNVSMWLVLDAKWAAVDLRGLGRQVSTQSFPLLPTKKQPSHRQ